MELSAIAKIHKYKRLHEGHHFVPMAMEVHNAHGRDMDHFIKKCAWRAPKLFDRLKRESRVKTVEK
jgi:hypothetical protein